MNDSWRNADADAHAAKAEALDHAIANLQGIVDALDNIEAKLARNAIQVLAMARDRHTDAAKLAGVK